MKFFLLLLLGYWLPDGIVLNEPTGIQFYNGSWQQVLAEAQRQHKPIYVDFYTGWCPPCRRMEREAFPNTTIGAKFNPNFVNYQLNAEAGEGVEIARRFGVASYPTALYLLPTGEVVHRGVGYGGVNAMLQQADMVLKMPLVRQFRRRRTLPPTILSPIPALSTDSLKNY